MPGFRAALAGVIVALTAAACAWMSPPPPATPDLEATVEAAVAAVLPTAAPTRTPDIDSTVEARMAAILAAIPAPAPVPTAAPTPTGTPTPWPAPTPTPLPSPTLPPASSPTPLPSATPAPTPGAAPTEDQAASLSEMVKQVRPAVVRIDTGSGSGSGVIFETQGRTAYVITNYHVVEGEVRVNVTVNDSVAYPGSVLGADSIRDLAVVSICCGAFRALSFGDAGVLQPGDEVVAIGYPLGLPGEATVTRGIVSAVRYDSEHLSNVIQTDAAINPGNSGGPMLSASGKILGINTFGYDRSESGRPVQGLSFAISEQTVRQQIPALQAGTPRPTPTPTGSPAATPGPEQTGDFGPAGGELRHDPSDDFIKTEYAGVSIADMMVEATFVNPYSAASNTWDYGFFFRDHSRQDSANPHIQVAVTSDGRWNLAWRETSSAGNQRLGGGTLGTFDTGPGGRNHLRVVAIEGRGWLFVNGEFVSALDLSEVTGAGDVAVITGAFEGDEVSGAVTRFENFRGHRLSRRYGPADGILVSDPGFIVGHGSGVWTRDLVTEAGFVSPPGRDWDYGFLIRNSAFNQLDVIVVTADGRWFHQTRDVGDDEYTEVGYGHLSDAGAGLLSRNRLLVIAFEGAGWLFVNDRLVAKLDLGHNLDSGDVSAMGGFFDGHTGEPSFEDFKVWAP